MLVGTKAFLETRDFFIKEKLYTKAVPGTFQYKEFWEEEKRKCLEGVTIGNLHIPGTYYFYLNYYPILGKDPITGRKTKTFPLFTDVDLEYFSIVEKARKEKKGVIMTKPRRTGFSFKNSSLVVHEYNFFRDAKCIIGSFESKLSENTMNMALDGLNFLDQNTIWNKPRNPDTKEFVKARHQKTVNGVTSWVGYQSEIRRITFKDNPQASVGLSASIFLFEEAALFHNIIESYNYSEPTWKDGNELIGVPILFGTGGDMGGSSDQFSEMFYNPDKFNLLAFDNIWEPEKSGQRCGWFLPATRQRFGTYKDKETKQVIQLVDEEGNSNVEYALKSIMEFRETKKGDPQAYKDAITQYPLTPSEAFLKTSKSPFPLFLIQERLAEIETNQSIEDAHWLADLVPSGDTIEFRLSKKERCPTFPIRDKNINLDFPIEIYEQPYQDKPAFGVYIAGCLTPGEKVLTNVGLKNVEDVSLTDKLINKDGELVNIINLQQYYVINEDTYKIKVANTFRTTNFTKEHPILSSKRITKYNTKLDTQRQYSYNFKFNKAETLNIGEWIKAPNIYNKLNPNYLHYWDDLNIRIDRKIDNPLKESEFWWFIGLWLGDGWVDKEKHKIYISFNSKEIQQIERCKKIISNIFKREFYERKRNNCIEISFSCIQFNTFLQKTFNTKALNKNIPEWIKYIEKENKVKLIQGYIDSDGSITESKVGYTTNFVSISLKLLEDVQDILFSLNCVSSIKKLRNASVTQIQGITSTTKETYQLSLNHYDTLKLISYLDKTTSHKTNKVNINKFIKRKAPKGFKCYLDETNDYIYFQITNIEKNKYTGVVYNFECFTHTFMCHHITTHNCDPYDDDEASSSDSLGSCIVMNTLTNRIVAQYTARPKTAKEFYENVRRLLMFYNATANYENNKKGLFSYFENKNSTYMLADTPKILKDQQILKTIYSQGNNAKGTNAAKEVNKYGRELIKTYLYDKAYGKEEESNLTNTHVIPSKLILKELELWTIDGNFDRVSALIMLMIYKEDRFKIIIERDDSENEQHNDFFDRYYQDNKNSYIGPDINSFKF